MYRSLILLLAVTLPVFLHAQIPLPEYRDLQEAAEIPSNINSTRTAVVIHISPTGSSPVVEGDWKGLSREVHNYLHRMGIDVVLYVNDRDYSASNNTRDFYQKILVQRDIENLIFIAKMQNEFSLVCTPFNKKIGLISNGQNAYTRESLSLGRMMLEFGRDIKRAELAKSNFLIPEKPTYLDVISVVQNSNLKNYPGQIRRSKLAVEKFARLPVAEDASDAVRGRIEAYNRDVDRKNQKLEEIVGKLPYDIDFIDYLSDEDLLRKRYQFVLRNVFASASSIRSILKYKDQKQEGGYVSVIPRTPNTTSIKTFPKNALLHKFYIRQNIAKNVYVGEWDADETWEMALNNYIGNMMQFFNKGN